MIINLASVITTLIFVRPWGKFSDKYGNLKTMNITGALIPLLPFLWFISVFFKTKISVLIFLFLVECFSGMIWAGFNIAAGNFIYDAVTRQRLAICATYFNILAGFGVLAGSMLGGLLSSHYPSILGINSLLIIFIISGIARFAVYFIMNSKIKEVRKVEPFILKDHVSKVTDKFMIGKSAKKFFESIGLDYQG
jgi:MFS family permease